MRIVVFMFLLAIILLPSCSNFYGKTSKRPCPTKRNIIRLKEFVRLSNSLGPWVWDGWNSYNQEVLFVDEENEYLFGYQMIPKGFQDTCIEGELGKLVFRKRQFDKRMEASFPAFGQNPTIVIGSVENTKSKYAIEWLSILFHERFHQIQYSQKNYYDVVKAITPKSAKDGSWMLNYAFPYNDKKINKYLHDLGKMLYRSIKTRDKKVYDEYMSKKQALSKVMKNDDLTYMKFQMWQEGTARYIELDSLLKLGSTKFDKMFLNDPILGDTKMVYSQKMSEYEKEISSLVLSRIKRGAFYSLGMFERIAEDIFVPDWKKSYFKSFSNLVNN